MPTDIAKIIGEVKNIKKSQDQARLDKSKFEGQLEQEIKRLESDFNLKGLTEADRELDKLQGKLDKIDTLIREKYKNLKDNYDVSQG